MSTQNVTAEQELDPVFFLAATDPEAMKAMNSEPLWEERGGDTSPFRNIGARRNRGTPLRKSRRSDAHEPLARATRAIRIPCWHQSAITGYLVVGRSD